MTSIPFLSTSFATQRPDDFYIASHSVFTLLAKDFRRRTGGAYLWYCFWEARRAFQLFEHSGYDIFYIFSPFLFVSFFFHFLCPSSLQQFPSPSPTGLHSRRERVGANQRASLQGQATSLVSPLHAKSLFQALIAPLYKL